MQGDRPRMLRIWGVLEFVCDVVGGLSSVPSDPYSTPGFRIAQLGCLCSLDWPRDRMYGDGEGGRAS